MRLRSFVLIFFALCSPMLAASHLVLNLDASTHGVIFRYYSHDQLPQTLAKSPCLEKVLDPKQNIWVVSVHSKDHRNARVFEALEVCGSFRDAWNLPSAVVKLPPRIRELIENISDQQSDKRAWVSCSEVALAVSPEAVLEVTKLGDCGL
jgi:hypothetical protein